MKATDRKALIQTLREYHRSLELFVATLDHTERETMALLRSAARSINSALERLTSSKERRRLERRAIDGKRVKTGLTDGVSARKCFYELLSALNRVSFAIHEQFPKRLRVVTDSSRRRSTKGKLGCQEPFSMMDRRTAEILASPTYRSHIVYPYTDDRHLVDAVGFYTASGLAREGAVILIVTPAHRQAIKKYLRSDGNVEALEARGRLSFLDASELLSTFMVDGMPDPTLFKAGIKALIERARGDEHAGWSRDMRLFGEMVSLLWPTNSAAAERLEELWNEKVEELSVPIFHAYSMGGSGREQLPESLIKAHSHVIAW